MVDAPLVALVQAIVSCEQFQSMWQINDRGVPVFAHSVDVVMLALEAFPEWQEKFPELSLRATTLGSLLHDLDKLNRLGNGSRSHSQAMTDEPERAVALAIDVLQQAQWAAGIEIDRDDLDHIWHVVASHHGTWGKVRPQTAEAALVHRCDFISATKHRVTPVDASDILPLLDQDLSWKQAASALNVSVAVLRARLNESCRMERVTDATGLLKVWRKRGFVVTGPAERMNQIEEVRQLLREARLAPDTIVDRLRSLGRLLTPH